MKQYLYAMGAIFCWASLPAATGSGLDGLSIEELLLYSFGSAALFLYGLDVAQKKSFRIALPGARASVLGVWGIFFYHFVYYQALARAPLAEAAILATTWSFWIVVFSSLVAFRRVQPGLVLAALVGLIGAGLVIASGKEVGFDPNALLGYGLALLCGLIWSSFSVGLSLLKLPEEPMTAFTLYAAVLSGGLYVASGPHPVPPPRALLAAIYLGFVPLGLSFFLWNRAVTGGNMAVIGLLSYCTPPLAVLLVCLIQSRPVAPQVLVGMTLVIAAALMGKRLTSPGRSR